MSTESYIGVSPSYTGVGINRHGQCQFRYASTTSCKLYPMDGNQLIINGVSYTIPSGGVNLANTDLASNDTTYYVYAYMSSGTMTLEAVATTHETDTSTGIEIKSGDATRTLVGMVRKTSGNFIDTGSVCFTRSWFHDYGFALNLNNTAYSGVLSASFVALPNGGANYFLTWGGDRLSFTSSLSAYASTAAAFTIGTFIDSSGPYGLANVAHVTTSGVWGNGVSHGGLVLSEGYHYTQVAIAADGSTVWTSSTYGGTSSHTEGREG